MRGLHLLKTAIVGLLAIGSLANPLPVEEDDAASLDIRIRALGKRATTPPLPTVDECKAQLTVAKDTSLFYSGPGGYAKKARDAIKDPKRPYLSKYKILGQMWKDPAWQNQWQNDEDASVKFFDICSQAMAKASTGTVYVILPEDTGTNWKAGTVWAREEVSNCRRYFHPFLLWRGKHSLYRWLSLLLQYAPRLPIHLLHTWEREIADDLVRRSGLI